MSWKVPILALESYCHGQKVGYLSQFKEEKIQHPLGVRGAKVAALFSIFGTGKYSNFKIIGRSEIHQGTGASKGEFQILTNR